MRREEIKAWLEGLWHKQTLSGSWIFCGSEGIGKSSLATDLAKYVLSGGRYDDEKTNFQVLNGSHPDFLLIRRGLTEKEKKERQKVLDSGKALDDEEELTRDRNSFIGVDDIRSIDKFIHMSPSGFSGWKMVIIDSADEMNLNASNALLKILEEPPEQTVMILISHNQSRLLPTILSRCRKVYFSCMRKDEIVDGLRGLGFDISSEEARGLSYLSGGSLGKAIFLKSNGGLNTYNDILNLFINFPQVNVNSIYKFTEKKEKEEKSYKLLKEVYITFLYRLICIQSGLIEEGYISELEKEVTGRILSLSDKEKLLLLWERSTELFNQAEVLYLDKKQVMVDSLLELSLCL